MFITFLGCVWAIIFSFTVLKYLYHNFKYSIAVKASELCEDNSANIKFVTSKIICANPIEVDEKKFISVKIFDEFMAQKFSQNCGANLTSEILSSKIPCYYAEFQLVEAIDVQTSNLRKLMLNFFYKRVFHKPDTCHFGVPYNENDIYTIIGYFDGNKFIVNTRLIIVKNMTYNELVEFHKINDRYYKNVSIILLINMFFLII